MMRNFFKFRKKSEPEVDGPKEQEPRPNSSLPTGSAG
jgi:hypothetical protein